jgi:hypothetical protein
VLLGLVVLAAAAIGDAVRGVTRGADDPSAAEAARSPTVRLVRTNAPRFSAAGPYLKKRVLRDGREYLSAEAVEAAFPVPVEGPIDIAKLAVAQDGTLALAVYRFPPQGDARGAVELWKGQRPVGAFGVPSGYFGGGLALNRDGTLVATFSYDGQLRGIFDRQGRPVSDAVDSFLYVD